MKNYKNQLKKCLENFDEEIPTRTLNKDNPQYTLGWNACKYLCEKFIEKIYDL